MIVDQRGLNREYGHLDIILRYYISNNSVGTNHFPVQDSTYMKEVNPDYIFIYTYDNYWEGCNNILEEGLIKNCLLNTRSASWY